MILLLSLMGTAVSGCLWATVTLVRGTLTTGCAKPRNKQCPRTFSPAAICPAWVKNFVVGILSGLERHIPRKKQLLIGILFIGFWGPLTRAPCASGSRKSRGEPKTGAMRVHHDLTLMGFLFSTFRSPREQWNMVCFLGSVPC